MEVVKRKFDIKRLAAIGLTLHESQILAESIVRAIVRAFTKFILSNDG